MGVLRDRTGKVVGAIDDGGRSGCELYSCKQSDAVRALAGCQPKGVVFDRQGGRQVPMCQKDADHRKLVGCDQAPASTKRTNEMGRPMRPYGARDAQLMDDDKNSQLRAVLSELGILDDDIEKMITRLSSPGSLDSAPSNMGSGDPSVPEEAMGAGDPGGGSMRSYAPTDGGSYGGESYRGAPSATDRRMAGDASHYAQHVQRTMAHRRKLYELGQITFDHLHAKISPPAMGAADLKRFHERYPDAARLK